MWNDCSREGYASLFGLFDLCLNRPKDSSIRSENRTHISSWSEEGGDEFGGGHPIPDLFCPTILVPLRLTKLVAGGRF
jgi:hypothetical protein